VEYLDDMAVESPFLSYVSYEARVPQQPFVSLNLKRPIWSVR
jgi:hypothetical protein